jgi:glycosyltransferase involved in cell wall biosynthesis
VLELQVQEGVLLMPKFSIITPTIIRPSLDRLCASIDKQSFKDYEHIIIVDIPFKEVTNEQKFRLEELVKHGHNRSISFCATRHQNYGHTCRHNISKMALGEYILYVDDDDHFADNEVLLTLNNVKLDWAIFPILRYKSYYLENPPGCKTGTGMFLHKRQLGTWPDRNDYEADGHFVEELKQKAPYEVFHCRPLIVMEINHEHINAI